MKVMLWCMDIVNTSMAGPAIRYWELAKVLSKQHEVTLITPNVPDITSDTFQICPEAQFHVRQLEESDVLITQVISYRMAITAKKHGVRIILDAYDPMPFEHLELFKSHTLPDRHKRNNAILEDFRFYFQLADAVICANDRQRDLWTGMMMALQRPTPEIYDADPTLTNLIDTVPFGMSQTPPKRSGDGMRKRFNLKPDDIVLLWGGGIWNWFDPLTLIQAVKQLRDENLPVKLVFMGIKHPNPDIPDMAMTSQAIQLAKELDILDKNVFFNYGWVPYDQRQNFLLDADIALSTHLSHLETRFAFRTRMLDYLWAGLPIVATAGDSFSDLIASKNLGRVVPPNDPQAIAKAVKEIALNAEETKRIKENIQAVKPQFYWSHVAQPLEKMLSTFKNQSRPQRQFKDLRVVYRSIYSKRGLKALCSELLSPAFKKRIKSLIRR